MNLLEFLNNYKNKDNERNRLTNEIHHDIIQKVHLSGKASKAKDSFLNNIFNMIMLYVSSPS